MGRLVWEQPGWAIAGAAALVLLALLAWTLRRRRRGGARQSLAWLLRGLVLALALTALAEPAWLARSGPRRLLVLIDRSASVPPRWTDRVLGELAAQAGPVELIPIAFADTAAAVSLPQALPIDPAPPADGSDPGPAAALAAALAPPQTPLLMLTDGNWTAPADGLDSWPGPVYALCPARPRPNASLTNLAAVAVDAQADRAAVRVSVTATRDGPADLTLLGIDPDGRRRALARASLTLSAGQSQSLDWFVQPGPAELLAAELEADWDELPGDNRLVALPPSPGERRQLLLLSDRPTGATAAVLSRLAGWRVTTVSPGQSQRAAALLRGGDPPAVAVLDDVPPERLDPALLTAAGPFVESGGGWLTILGPATAGRLAGSPLGTLLAADPTPRDRAPAAVVLLLDRSGSMSEPPAMTDAASASKLDLVKQAVLALPDVFAPGDRLAVIGFNDQAKLLYAGGRDGIDWRELRRAMLDLDATGGTAIEPALRLAGQWLADQPVSKKHVLLLSDGQFSDVTDAAMAGRLLTGQPDERPGEDVRDRSGEGTGARSGEGPNGRPSEGAGEETEERPSQPGGDQPPPPTRADEAITVSTFATSEQADRRFLRELAGRFGGRFYPPGDWGELRERFRDDLLGAVVQPIIDGPIAVIAVGDRPALPAVAAMAASEPRATTGLWYVGRAGQGRARPLVALRPVGAGRSGLLASGLDDWAASWTAAGGPAQAMLSTLLDELAGSPGDPRFALQVAPTPGGVRLELLAEQPPADTQPGGDTQRGGDGRPVATRPAGRPMNLLELHATIESDGRTVRRRFVQVGPGRYELTAALSSPSRVAVSLGDRTVVRRTLAPALPAEFSHLQPRPAELEQLCRRSGGRLLESVVAPPQLAGEPARRSRPLWPWLLLAAVAAWVAEVVVGRPAGRG